MTTLYRPVLIESAEQAEALPIGTVAKLAKWHASGEQDYYSAVRVGCNAWVTTSDTADRQDSLSRHMVDWTALVPIEAEEEWAIAHDEAPAWSTATEQEALNAAKHGAHTYKRHRTTWEPQQ